MNQKFGSIFFFYFYTFKLTFIYFPFKSLFVTAMGLARVTLKMEPARLVRAGSVSQLLKRLLTTSQVK